MWGYKYNRVIRTLSKSGYFSNHNNQHRHSSKQALKLVALLKPSEHDRKCVQHTEDAFSKCPNPIPPPDGELVRYGE